MEPSNLHRVALQKMLVQVWITKQFKCKDIFIPENEFVLTDPFLLLTIHYIYIYNDNNLASNLWVGPSGWVAPSAPLIPLDGYSDLPPPTYEQAITADEGDQIYFNI